MISRMQAQSYRCFRRLDVALGAYNVLAGANGSGKSTLLDIPSLFSNMLSRGLIPAFLDASPTIGEVRAQSLQELIYCYQGDSFGFALEATLPPAVRDTLFDRLSGDMKDDKKKWPHTLRYEIRFQIVNQVELHVTDEFLWLLPEEAVQQEQERFIGGQQPSSWKPIIQRLARGAIGINAEYQYDSLSLHLEPQQLALANLPLDASLFPAAVWFVGIVKSGMMRYEPDLLGVVKE